MVTRGDSRRSRPVPALSLFPLVPLYDASRVRGWHSSDEGAGDLRRQALALRRMVETGDDSSFRDVDECVAPAPSHRAGRRNGWVTAVRSAWRVRKIFEALP